MAQIIRPKETTIPIMVAMSTLLLVQETAVEVARAGWPGGTSVPAFQPEGKLARTMPAPAATGNDGLGPANLLGETQKGCTGTDAGTALCQEFDRL
jgi:hypothetical protein